MIVPILLDVLAPILLMVGFGALLRWKFKIGLGTLSKLNLFLFVPAFVFDKVAHSGELKVTGELNVTRMLCLNPLRAA